MVSLFGILNIGSRGLSAAQAALNTTGNNISNADTEGYSRQRVVQTTTDPIVYSFGAMGQGSEIVTVERIRDMLLESQINAAISDKNYNDQLNQVITRLQAYFKDPLNSVTDKTVQASTGGLNSLLSKFFSAFQALSNSPETSETRLAAIDSAETLAQAISVASSNLSGLREDLNEDVSYYVKEINSKTKEIALLNKEIATTEGGKKVNANDFRDRRDQLINELSEIIPIKTIENPNGTISISLVGQNVVDNVSQKPLVLETVRGDSSLDITSIRIGEEGLDIVDSQIRNGKLGAILDSRDRIIPELQDQLDTLARGVIFEANKIHCQASGVAGYQSVSSNFVIPAGADEPDTNLTLETIFNNPVTRSQQKLSDTPYPVQNGTISIRVADENNATRDLYSVDLKTSDTLYDVVERIDRSDGVVNTARSSLSFNPVYIEQAQAQKGASRTEINLPLSSLSAAAGAPIAGAAGSYTFQIHLRNKAGSDVDSNTATTAVDPYTVTITSAMTLQQAATAIQTAGGGKLRAQLVPSESDPTATVLRIEGVEDGSTISIQNDTSGLIEAFDFPVTDPSLPLIGGNASEATASFTGTAVASLLGSGSPMFNTVFTASSPTVIGEGNFNLVVVNNLNQVVSKTAIAISATGVDTLNEVAAAMEAANSHLSVDITADGKFTVASQEGYSFFFQDDTTGLIDAMGFSEINGYGKIGEQAFQSGSFEIVVANEEGTVTQIVEVPINADPSVNGGLVSLNDIVAQINGACGDYGAPLQASIVVDPTNPSMNQLQIKAETGYEFTFRSDDSLLLSALGFVDGPVLKKTDDAPLLGAVDTVAVGDSIGGLVRARIADNGTIEISTTENDQLTFVGDSSHFLAATQINALFTGSNALSMGVNKEISNNADLLAASKDGTVGNNEAALTMAKLQDKTVVGSMSLNGYYRFMIAGLGNEGSRVLQSLASTESILSELKTLREQDSGVSVDEESVNLIRFQRAYQASARFINTIDQLLDVVINQLGA